MAKKNNKGNIKKLIRIHLFLTVATVFLYLSLGFFAGWDIIFSDETNGSGHYEAIGEFNNHTLYKQVSGGWYLWFYMVGGISPTWMLTPYEPGVVQDYYYSSGTLAGMTDATPDGVYSATGSGGSPTATVAAATTTETSSTGKFAIFRVTEI
jgi:hypothetical protein